MLYRVVNPDSSHYGELGRRVYPEEVMKARGINADDPWLTQWHLFLDIGGTGNMGSGYWWVEVEFAGYKAIIKQWLRK